MLENCNSIEECNKLIETEMKNPNITLIGELNFNIRDKEKLQNLFLPVIQNNLELRYNNAFAFLLVLFAVFKEEKGSYWDTVSSGLNIKKFRSMIVRQRNWKESFFNRLLILFQDSRYNEEERNGFVKPILYHACFPNYLLNKYFNDMIFPFINWTALSNEEIISEQRLILQKQPEPIQYFYRKSSPIAEDLSLRILRYARVLESNNDNYKNIQLPDRIIEYLKKFNECRKTVNLPATAVRVKKLKCELSFEDYGDSGSIILTIYKNDYPINDINDLTVWINEKKINKVIQFYSFPGCLSIEENFTFAINKIETQYHIELKNGDISLLENILENPIEGVICFDADGKFIRKNKLPKDCYIICNQQDRRILDEKNIIQHSGSLMNGYSYCRIEAVAIEDILFDKERILYFDKPVKILGSENCKNNFSNEKYEVFCTDSLRIENVGGLSDYCISITFKDEVTKNVTICKDMITDGYIDLIACQFINPCNYGKYLLYIQGPLGKSYTFNFIYLPEIEVKFDKIIYQKGGTANITICKAGQIEIDDIEVIDNGHNYNINIKNVTGNIEIKLISYDGIKLTLSLPVIEWTLLLNGTPNPKKNITLDELLNAKLRFTTNNFNLINIKVTLIGIDQEVSLNCINGKAELPLGQFHTSIVTSNYGKVSFQLIGQGMNFSKILTVEANWEIHNFKYFYTIEALELTWQENIEIKKRMVRLWNLINLTDGVEEFLIPDNETRISIDKIQPSEYIVEFVYEDNYGIIAKAKIRPALGEGVNTFNICLFDEDQKNNLLTNFIKNPSFEDQISAFQMDDRIDITKFPNNSTKLRWFFFYLFYLCRNEEYLKLMKLLQSIKASNCYQLFLKQSILEAQGLLKNELLSVNQKTFIPELFCLLDYAFDDIIPYTHGQILYSELDKRNYIYSGCNSEGKIILKHRNVDYDRSIREIIEQKQYKPKSNSKLI